jgi:ferrochelatase
LRGLLVLNLGTPDAPETRAVRRYLREFLSDPRVLDIPQLLRAFLLHVCILPFRPRRTAEAYRKVWMAQGSPLLVHGRDLVRKLQSALGSGVRVELAMRYQSPSIASALDTFRSVAVDRVAVLPLFPQYSSAASGSALEDVYRQAGRRWNTPSLEVVPPFYDHPAFIDALREVTAPCLRGFRPDRVLMSFHGLPERQVLKSDESGGRHCLKSADCCAEVGEANRLCYRAHCFATARVLAAALALPDASWEVAFQSRLGREPWIRPFTDVRVRELAKSGVRRLAVVCPSFVADCLETLEEIGIRARDDFIAHGGEDLCAVPCLNSHDVWVRAAVRIVAESTSLRPDAVETR